MYDTYAIQIKEQLARIKDAGLYKNERIIESPQSPLLLVKGEEVLNLCANNYLGLSNDETVRKAAGESLDVWGFGMSSVRFICGTLSIHKELEKRLSAFLGMEDTILYSSCFDANGGLFETLLGPEDAIISDELNHASIIDGVRLCKAKRYRYANNNMAALKEELEKAKKDGARNMMIATDGVFSMDGYLANLPGICDLADEYGALVMVDDSHAVGFVGEKGGGTPQHYGVAHRIDILTGTLGKALGGASGGFTAAKKEIVELLRQRSRPYLFSNSLAPSIVSASLAVLDILEGDNDYLPRLKANTRFFRDGLKRLGFSILEGEHPIIPVMFYDEKRAVAFAEALLAKGIYVIPFSYPVVPKGQARIRVQMSSALNQEDLSKALEAFGAVKRELLMA